MEWEPYDPKDFEYDFHLNDKNFKQESLDLDYISVREFKSDFICCNICFEEFDISKLKPMIIECGHTLCNKCLKSILTSGNKKCCPFCNKVLTKSQLAQYNFNYSYMDIIREFKNVSKKPFQNFVEKTFKDGKYKGEILSKKEGSNIIEYKHGKGKMTYLDDSVYEGNWVLNERSGKGYCIYKDSIKYKYDGEWLNDVPNGYGTLEFSSGEYKSYEGHWKNGKFHGIGVLTYANSLIKKETVFIEGNSNCEIMKYTTKEYTLFGTFNNGIIPSLKNYKIENNSDIFYGELNKFHEYSDGVLYKNNGKN